MPHSRLLVSATCAVGALAGWRAHALAAVVLNSLAPYEQHFEFLENTQTVVSWTDDAPTETINGSPGWFLQSPNFSLPTYEVYDAGVDPIPPMLGGGAAYSLTNSPGDQALGSRNGSALMDIAWGVVFKNNTSQTITSLTVSYTGEQWRRATLADSLLFSYRTSATAITDLTPTSNLPPGWTANASLNFQAPQVLASPAARIALDGNLVENRANLNATLPVTVAPGDFFALRWFDFDAAGASDAAMGIDDLTVTFAAAVPECSALAAGAMMTVAMASHRLLRRRSLPRRDRSPS